MRLNIIRIIIIAMLIGTFYIIFSFSNQNSKESSSVSKKVSKILVETFNKDKSEEVKMRKVKKVEPFTRKMAHFLIYVVVGFLLMSLFCTYNMHTKKRIIISIILGFIYACSDEIHQLFVSGRSGEIRDVLIDSAGVFVGICICYKIYKMSKNILLKKYNYDSI